MAANGGKTSGKQTSGGKTSGGQRSGGQISSGQTSGGDVPFQITLQFFMLTCIETGLEYHTV